MRVGRVTLLKLLLRTLPTHCVSDSKVMNSVCIAFQVRCTYEKLETRHVQKYGDLHVNELLIIGAEWYISLPVSA